MPYQRTPLSKDCWWVADEELGEKMYFTTSDGKYENVSYGSAEMYPKNIQFILSDEVVVRPRQRCSTGPT